jgi:hypothetical protein
MNVTFYRYIYGLDIETSTIGYDSANNLCIQHNNEWYIKSNMQHIESDDIVKKCSFMYSFCVSCIDSITGEYTKLKFGRTYEELDNYLYELNAYMEDRELTGLVYIHNLSYEYSFFCNNLDFFKSDTRLNNKGYMFLEKNKPLYYQCHSLQFRCSYLLLNKSIKTLGKELNLPKLDYNYTKLRTPLTHMEQEEINYNFRDVEIMLKSVYSLIKKNPYITNLESIPYTKTGIMRFNCEQNPDINVSEYYTNKHGEKKKGNLSKLNKFLCKLENAKSKEQLDFWEKLFQGGLVYSNPKYIGQVNHNLGSFDFSSDYPFQMLTRIFPSQFVEFDGDKVKKLKQCMYKATHLNYIRPKPFRNMFNAIIIISDIKAKFDFQPIGTSKIEELNQPLKNMYNCKIINGKILEIQPKIRMYVTCIDYLTLSLFYEFKLVDVEYLEIATRYKATNEFKLNSVEYNGRKKAEYKVYNSLLENATEYKQYSKEEIQEDFFRNMVNSEKDLYAQKTTAKQIYQNVKADLNALYGDNAQHLLRDKISYDNTSWEYIEEQSDFENDYLNKQHKTSYIYGLYVPQYARASILYIAYIFLIKGIDVYYIDTDSIKVKYSAFVQSLVDEFNKLQLESLGKYKYLGFGVLELEFTATNFTSLGTKSYIFTKKEKGKELLQATISGLPNATMLFNKIYDYYGKSFDEMVESCYHYGTIFDRKIANRLASTYKFERYDLQIGDYTESVVSGVVLESVDVTMRDFNTKTWGIYAKLICNLYNKDYDLFTTKTIITLDSNKDLYIE